MTNVAINGFGRIGRAFFKLALTRPELNIVAINDLGDSENLAYLLRYDSAYGRYGQEVSVQDADGTKMLSVGGSSVLFLQEKDPANLPWDELKIDIVVEATGVFTKFEQAQFHVDAGAKRVVLTAPAKDEDGPDAKTVLMGVNSEELKTCTLSSNGSCTTNSASPILQILSDTIGVEKAFLNTTHGYTATQALIDGPTKGKDYRRGRAAAANIIPSETGSAIAVGRAVHSVTDKFDGIATRVPLLTGSLSAIIFLSSKKTTVEEINDVFRKAEKEDRWAGIFKTTDEQLVSSDIVGDPYAAIADLTLTKVVDGNLCAVYSWYDNEFGYTNSLVDHVMQVAQAIA
jgi:glyceraldehyde 3-phosphate dehydrogenase